MEDIRDSQRDIKKGKIALEDLIWEQEDFKDKEITEEMLETLRDVNEEEPYKLQQKLNEMSLDLEDSVTAIRDLMDSPTKFQEDK